MKKSLEILNLIQKKSVRKIENTDSMKIYLKESLEQKKSITFYNWECPPRFIDKAKNGQLFINYNVDHDVIANKKQVDEYTELPRIITDFEKQKNIIEFLTGLGLNFRFVKLIADTNLYYLTPESRKYVDANLAEKKFKEFKMLIKERSDGLPCKTEVMLFSDMIRPWQDLYNESFYKALKMMNIRPCLLVRNEILELQFQRTKEHVGISDDVWAEEFSKRTIASYAAEGIIFNELSKSERYSNCVWLNIEEVDQRTIEITNCLRLKKGIARLPMVFPEN